MGGCSLTIPLDTSTLAAQIKYLPKREEILKWSPEQVPYGLENNVFGHPVLIISPKVDKKGKVVVFPMTSFKNRNILAKYPEPKHRRIRETYWPIKPTPIHPNTGTMLQLRDGRPIDKNYSYINSQASYPIPYEILAPYNGDGPEDVWVLDDESYEKVTKGRNYDKFHGSCWRREEEKTPSPVPEAVKKREEEGKQASKAKILNEIDLAMENRYEILREYYEEVKDFWPWHDFKITFGFGEIDDPDPC